MIMNFKSHIKLKTKVFSIDHGAGEVISLFKWYDGIEDYFEVRYLKSNITQRTSFDEFLSQHTLFQNFQAFL